MSSILFYILNVLLNLVEVFMLFQLGNCFFAYHGSRKHLIYSLLFMSFSYILVLVFTNDILLFKLFFLIISNTFWLWIIYQSHPLKCCAVSIFFVSLVLVGDNFFLMGLEILLDSNVNMHTESPYNYYGFCFAVKIIELFLISVLKIIMHSHTAYTSVQKQDWLRIIAFPFMSTIIICALTQIFSVAPEAAPQILFCSIILLLTDMLAITLLNYLEQQQKSLRDYSILQHSLKLEHDNVEAWKTAYSSQRKQTHDYQNQLLTIRGLAQNRNGNSELIEYVSRLLQTDMTDAMLVQTGRSVVDVILNQKHALSKGKGIMLTAQLDDLREFALPDEALVVVLSNLIDNAIEACDKNKTPEHKAIKLRMQAEPEVSFLFIENYSEDPVKIVGNHIISTKPDYLSHGYGTKNIAAIMEQYGAEYIWDYQDDTHLFCFSAQITPT